MTEQGAIKEMTDSDVIANMLGLARYLAMQNDDSNQIELKINNLASQVLLVLNT